MYKVGEHVVYPHQGLGEIIAIEQRMHKDVLQDFFVIYIASTDMHVRVPINNIDELGVRPVSTIQEIRDILEFIKQEHTLSVSDWKTRYQNNVKLLKQGDLKDIATVVYTLYKRSTVKELPIAERRLYEQVWVLFISELAFVLQKTESEIKSMVIAILQVSTKKSSATTHNTTEHNNNDMVDTTIEDNDNNES